MAWRVGSPSAVIMFAPFVITNGKLPLTSSAVRASGGGLAMRQLPPRPREMAVVAVRDALQVVLVLGLGLPERDGLAELGHDLARPQARGVDVGDRVLGHL